MIELRECPFCGTVPTGENKDIVYQVGEVKDVYQCVCSNPDCSGTVLGWDVDSAMEAWNTRSTDDKIENLEIETEVQEEYIIKMRQELKDAYKHVSLLTVQLDESLEKQFEMEMEAGEWKRYT